MPGRPDPETVWPIGGGETAAAIRDHDWSGSVLGPPERWPAALRMAVGLILDSPESMFLAWGPDLIFFHNDAYRSVLGPRLAAALGAPIADLWSDVWEQVKPLVDKALAGEASRFDDLPLTMARRGATEQTWWSFSYSPLRDEAGVIRGFFCITNETTERVLAAGAQRQREAELRLVTDSLPILVAFVDRDLVYRYANRAYEDWLFRSAESVIGLSIPDVVDAAGFEIRRPAIRRALGGAPAKLELDWPHRDGRPRIAEIRYLPRRADDGSVDGFYIVVLDITERRRAEAVLRDSNLRLERRVAERTRDHARSEARFRAMFDASPEFLFLFRLGQDGRLLYDDLNVAAEGLYRRKRDAVIGRTPAEVVEKTAAAPIERHARESLSDGATKRYEVERRFGDGPPQVLDVVVAPIGTDADGDPLVLFCGRDVTEQRRAEEALRQSQKMEAIGHLTGGVAHDFNNLLTVIRSSIDLLKRPDLAEARRRRYIEAIADTTARAAKLTGQLLAFARRQPLQPSRFDIGKSVEALGEMMGTLTGSRIRIETRLPGVACFVHADPSQFDTAVVNLAVNARDAMKGQGTLTIGLDILPGIPSRRNHPPVAGDFAALTVSDTGSGIAPEDLDRIFEPFFTTKGAGQGTGLGLSQVIGFAKQSGGDVAVKSDVGRGTSFVLYLPRVSVGDADAVATPDREASLDGEGIVVLVVEDNPEVGAFATEILSELGFRFVLAGHAEAALAELAADARRFDVVFSDVVMPGMDGIAFAREVRRRNPDLPVVLTSGYSHVLAEEGSSGFELLGKPYSIDRLSAVLKKAARRRGEPRRDG